MADLEQVRKMIPAGTQVRYQDQAVYVIGHLLAKGNRVKLRLHADKECKNLRLCLQAWPEEVTKL